MPTAALFAEAPDGQRPRQLEAPGNAATGALFAAHEYFHDCLTEAGQAELQRRVAAAAVDGLNEVFEVLEQWYLATLFECDPEKRERLDAATGDVDLSGAVSADEFLADYR